MKGYPMEDRTLEIAIRTLLIAGILMMFIAT